MDLDVAVVPAIAVRAGGRLAGEGGRRGVTSGRRRRHAGGVAGLVVFGVVIVIGLVAWVRFAMTSTDSLERALAPLGFVFVVGLGSIPVGLINLIGAILGVAAMDQVRTPEEGKYVSRALRLNAIPVVIVVAAVLLFLLLSAVLSSAYMF